MSSRTSSKHGKDPSPRPAFDKVLSAAVAHQQAGRLEEAKNLYLQILATDPRHAESLYGLGLVAERSGNSEVAARMFRRAVSSDPGNDEVRFHLATVLQTSGKYGEALGEFREVLRRSPDHVLARFRVGNLLQLEGKLGEAIAEYQGIVKLRPDSYDAQFNIGNVRRLQGELAEARRCYEDSLRIRPGSADAQWNLSLLDLLEGNYTPGWRSYEVRHHRPTYGLREFALPQWRGETLHGDRILLHAEQGLGDTLQFLRYVRMVAECGGEVWLDVPVTIRRLAAEIPGVSALIESSQSPPPPVTWHCPLMSLPLAFQTTVSSIPARVPYLSIPNPAKRSAEQRSWPARGLRVGLIWGATPRSFEDSDRSIPLSFFEPVLGMRGIHFFSLQMGPSAGQLETSRAPVTDLSPAISDFADTAALVSQLHLVITVDTSVAHLAGALAKPTWILLPFAADWRWLIDREDSPWYPTARLFRQAQPRDWQAVIAQVRGELEILRDRT
jgi:Flp pilus assembly protein TadD